MIKEQALIELDKVIDSIPEGNKNIESLWCSAEIYTALDLTEHRGFKIHTHKLMPKDYIVTGSLYF